MGLTKSLGALPRVLTVSGSNIGIGTTSIFGEGDSTRKVLSINGSSDAMFNIGINGTYTGVFYASATQTVLGSYANLPTNIVTNNTPRITVLSGGNVGIGVTSPGVKLDIDGDVSATGIVRLSKGASDTIQQGSTIYLVGGTGSSYTQLQQGVGRFTIWGYNGSSWGEKLTIRHSDGNVGIGTTSPSNLLSVGVPNSTTGKGISIENTSGTVFGRFGVINPSVDNNTYIGSFSNNDFLLYSNSAERMRITPGGNVLIGTTSDGGAKLSISQPSAGGITQQAGNSNNQGTAVNTRIVRHYPVVSAGTKLIIPFVNQGNLNSTTVISIMGHGALWNTPTPKGFQGFIQVGHLNGIAVANLLSSSGNISGITTSGSNLEINFTSAYTSATANGVYVTIDYMTNVVAYSISVANIAMN